MEPTVANFHNTTGVVRALAQKTRCRVHGFNQTRIHVNRHLYRSGRRGARQILSLKVDAEEKYERSRFVGPKSRGESPDQRCENVRKVALSVKSSMASRLSINEPNEEDSNENFGRTAATALRIYFNEVTTGFERILKDPNPAGALGNVLREECNMLYLMMCNDISAAVLPFFSLGANVLATSPFIQTGDTSHLLIQAATTMSKEFVYGFLYLLSFNLANQYNGADGDAIDKPWRPIPSGLLTKEGCLARCILVNLLYSFVSWHLGVLGWTLMWQSVNASQFFVCEKDNSSGGLGRSVAMFVGTVAMCGAGVSMATPMTPQLLSWTVARGALVGNHHWLQDFRDVEGDQRVGRTTFPLMIGVERARKLMAFIFLMEPLFVHFAIMKDSNYSTPQLILEGLGAVICAVLAYRVMYSKTPAEDRDTYTWWLATYWHNWLLLLVGPTFVMGL